jgi:hypothetical protein
MGKCYRCGREDRAQFGMYVCSGCGLDEGMCSCPRRESGKKKDAWDLPPPRFEDLEPFGGRGY